MEIQIPEEVAKTKEGLEKEIEVNSPMKLGGFNTNIKFSFEYPTKKGN